MVVDVDVNWVMTGVLAVAGAMGTLHTRAIKAENQNLKVELDLMGTQHCADMKRVDCAHEEIWQEIKFQRESLAQNREAVIRLTSSIERLNDILPRLEQVVMAREVHEVTSHTIYNRRATDRRPQTENCDDLDGPTDF